MAILGKHQFGAIQMILSVFLVSRNVSAASNFTKPYRTTLLIEVIISVILLGMVIGLLYFFIKNNKAGETGERKKLQNEKKFEIIWTLGATLIVMGLFLALIGPTSQIYNPEFSGDVTETIRVTGLPEFTWEFTFENGTSFKANNATYDYTIQNPETKVPYAALRLKANTPYHLEITSTEDPGSPIHSFFVYELSIKADAVPGNINDVYIEITEPGIYWGACAELCGINHWNMLFVIEVTP